MLSLGTRWPIPISPVLDLEEAPSPRLLSGHERHKCCFPQAYCQACSSPCWMPDVSSPILLLPSGLSAPIIVLQPEPAILSALAHFRRDTSVICWPFPAPHALCQPALGPSTRTAAWPSSKCSSCCSVRKKSARWPKTRRILYLLQI
jgi:hypothetical protein